MKNHLLIVIAFLSAVPVQHAEEVIFATDTKNGIIFDVWIESSQADWKTMMLCVAVTNDSGKLYTSLKQVILPLYLYVKDRHGVSFIQKRPKDKRHYFLNPGTASTGGSFVVLLPKEVCFYKFNLMENIYIDNYSGAKITAVWDNYMAGGNDPNRNLTATITLPELPKKFPVRSFDAGRHSITDPRLLDLRMSDPSQEVLYIRSNRVSTLFLSSIISFTIFTLMIFAFGRKWRRRTIHLL